MARNPPSTRRIDPVTKEDARGDARIDRRAHQFLAFAEPVHGRVLHDAGHALLGEKLAVLLGRKKAGLNGVDADLMRRQIPRPGIA